ncbi:hypothetical protein A3A05_01650 [Candidatus Nomurabacteria bacterium RIFCSPLOWO2_01_FULL_41_12]|uniref:Uncharacterized protein n=1 Tax=Candidatus Nomurabacteria bacterium RIFCSPLOWO2_01_FULL_41_12 TaxID=1801774 RepID=A0A1F6WUR6_9BACT|nr:MAG: hypothetical protein A2732_00995 [Candidatus Nomurabacteria bacterium RIFCSPHIGHO2_01_FULL_40_10]OGI85609.1 MAG: hypothetical protein A3A05_01650 [Candidatus Nomurabacteria bacterium RIFCSPLOWO2_01_FULL_41_12]
MPTEGLRQRDRATVEQERDAAQQLVDNITMFMEADPVSADGPALDRATRRLEALNKELESLG